MTSLAPSSIRVNHLDTEHALRGAVVSLQALAVFCWWIAGDTEPPQRGAIWSELATILADAGRLLDCHLDELWADP